jgi:hypothetical protein
MVGSAAPAAQAASGSCGTATLVAVNTSDTNLYRWTAPNAASPSWTSRTEVGTGWGGIGLTAVEDGWQSRQWSGATAAKLYAIDGAGTLRLYTFNGSRYTGGTSIGAGYDTTTKLLAVGGGVIYTVRSNGDLYWHRYVGARIEAWNGIKIGSGWGGFAQVFSGGNGIVYAVRSNGELLWYRHKTPAFTFSSENRWTGPKVIGSGWGGLRNLVSAGDGVIYGINASQQLVKYNHLGAQSGAVSWANGGTPVVVGSGWGSYNRLAVNPRACATPTPRADSLDRTVYFVHGVDGVGTPGTNCGDSILGGGTWGSAISRFEARGWTGRHYSVQFYAGDTNCTAPVIAGDRDTSLGTIGRMLAWQIYDQHSQFGEPVDIVAHSMGGLISRVVVDYTQRRLTADGLSFPPFVLVEDVATLSTPHNGSLSAAACDPGGDPDLRLQCDQMLPGSPFLASLSNNPQSAMGTDWTLISSNNDRVVDLPSALALFPGPGYMSPGHLVAYLGEGYGHSDMTTGVARCCHRVQYWNYHGRPLFLDDVRPADPIGPGDWRTESAGIPVDWAYNAVRYWSEW